MPDIFLYPGTPLPPGVVLSDPTVVRGVTTWPVSSSLLGKTVDIGILAGSGVLLGAASGHATASGGISGQGALSGASTGHTTMAETLFGQGALLSTILGQAIVFGTLTGTSSGTITLERPARFGFSFPQFR